MTAHTPGPYRVAGPDEAASPFVIVRTDGDHKGESIADCEPGSPGYDPEEAKATTHLLAASPNLLEALRPLAALPVGAEIAEDRDLVLYKNAGRAVTVGDILSARAAIAEAIGAT